MDVDGGVVDVDGGVVDVDGEVVETVVEELSPLSPEQEATNTASTAANPQNVRTRITSSQSASQSQPRSPVGVTSEARRGYARAGPGGDRICP